MNNKKIIQKIVLGGVVIKDGKALILQRHKDEDIYPGMWELPSGKREPLEPSETSLLREIKDEAGFDVEIIMPISVFDYQIEKPDEIRDSTQVNFLVRPIGDSDVKLSLEHQAFAWTSSAELENYEVTDATRDVINKAFELSERLAI